MFLEKLKAFLAYSCFVVPTAVFSSTFQYDNSLPLCPPKQARDLDYPYVIYGNKPALCYVAGSQGPCSSEGSILFARPRSPFGVCSCECFLGEGIIFDDSLIVRYRYCLNKRTGDVFVYDKERCNCYKLGSQGPCPAGKVLHKDIYEADPKCVREDVSNESHTQIEQRCPTGTIYSTLLNMCTDMNFRGLNNSTSSSSSSGSTSGRCPPGTIYSTLLNVCTDMNFRGLNNSTSSSSNSGSTSGRCPPGTIYSTLLNICTDMNFRGLSSSSSSSSGATSGRCPPGTIYSTLLNICTDMNFRGLKGSSSGGSSNISRKCPEGTIYSTLLNKCTDMSFRGLTKNSI